MQNTAIIQLRSNLLWGTAVCGGTDERRFIPGKVGVRGVFMAVVLASSNAIAQETQRTWKVGTMWHAANAQGEGPMYQAFMGGMRDLGYVEGRNVIFDHTFADEDCARFQPNAQGLVESKVDIIMASVADAAAAAAKTTTIIPIVFAVSGDPVMGGLVESIDPGKNVTGFSLFYPELTVKHLEILREQERPSFGIRPTEITPTPLGLPKMRQRCSTSR